MKTLEEIEWHDLPVESLAIESSGIRMHVTPFNEEKQSYENLILELNKINNLSISINSNLGLDDLTNMEISTFTYKDQGLGQIEGKIGILPGSSGYWEITFSNASWELINA